MSRSRAPLQPSIRIGGGEGPLKLVFFLSVVVAPLIILLAFSDPQDAYLWLVWCMGIAFSVLVAFEWRRVGHPLTPVGIIGLGGLLIAFLRPLTVLSSQVTTAGAEAHTMRFAGAVADAGTTAIVQWLLFTAALGAVYFHRSRRAEQATPTGSGVEEVSSDGMVRRAGTVLVGVMLYAAFCVFTLIRGSGGLSAHLAGLSTRSEFLAGRYFLTLSYLPLCAALVVYIIVRRRRPGPLPVWSPLSVTAAFTLIGVAILTGGRGPLLLGVLVPLLLLKQLGPDPIRSLGIALVGVGLIAGAMVMSLALRENTYTEGRALAELAADPAGVLSERLASGAETRPFDSLILLNYMDAQGQVDRQWGKTYPTFVTYFVPSGLVGEKQGGANTYFTKRYLPTYYYPNRIETSISAIGEAFLNFGWPGIPVMGGLVGLAAGVFTARGTGQSLQRTAGYVLFTPFFFSFIRSDSYQNLSVVSALLLFTFVLTGVVRGGGDQAARPPKGRPAALSTMSLREH